MEPGTLLSKRKRTAEIEKYMKLKTKHKYSIAAGALMLGLGSMAGAQDKQMVAAWDFSQFAGNGFSVVDGTIQQFAQANYTDFPLPDGGQGFSVNGGPAWGDGDTFGAVEFGRMLYDGTNGSSALDIEEQEVGFNGDADMTARNSVGDGFTIGASGQINVLEQQGQPNGNAFGTRFRDQGNGMDGKSFVLAIDLTGPNAAFGSGSAWQVDFAAKTETGFDGNASIDWAYSTDGSNYVSFDTTDIQDSEAGYTLDFSGENGLDDVSEAFFRGTIQGVDGETGGIAMDNVSVSAVPEPSTFAGIAGLLALAFAGARRRVRR